MDAGEVPAPSPSPAAAAGTEFVDGWIVAQLLGEGAYGEVRLLVHARSGACVALKAARGDGAEGGAREAALHRALRHPHVLRCLGARSHANLHYTFLEYAPGGELFDRIEPERGVPAPAARRYAAHLLRGLQYLHARGVAHRDIKPENLLLDAHDVLKISDFGMATLFRHGDRERLLSRVCGTLPYAAPEVLLAAERPYRAPPADVWAACVVLCAMLTGELPWERAHPSCGRYTAWARGEGGGGGAVRGAAAALLRRGLHPDPARRTTLDQLLQHRWMQAALDPGGGDSGSERSWHSQPAPSAAAAGPDAEAEPELSAADMDALISHSQPAHADDLVLGSPRASQAGSGAGAALGALARLARRMTRVWVRGAPDAALAAAARALHARRPHARLLALEFEGELRVRAWPVRVAAGPERTLLEFRRWRGCGMAFKRKFLELREALRPLAPDLDPMDAMDIA